MQWPTTAMPRPDDGLKDTTQACLGKIINGTAQDGSTPSPKEFRELNPVYVQNKTFHQLRMSLDSHHTIYMLKSVFLSPSRKALDTLTILASYTESE